MTIFSVEAGVFRLSHFGKILRDIVEAVSVDVVNNFSRNNQVVGVGLVPDIVGTVYVVPIARRIIPLIFGKPENKVLLGPPGVPKPSAAKTIAEISGAPDPRPNLLRHSSRGLVRAGATTVFRDLVRYMDSFKFSLTNGAHAFCFHGPIITWNGGTCNVD